MKLAHRVKDISASLTLAITAKAKKMLKKGISVINFAAGEPDFDTPKTIKNAAVSAIEAGFTKYTPSSGTNELKEAIIAKFKRDNGLNYKSSQILVSCGAKHSLYNIFQVLCDSGDEVIIPSPYWVSYPEMVKLAGAKPAIIKTDPKNGFKLTDKELNNAYNKHTKAIIINSPSNPTGSVYSKEDLLRIAKWAISKNIFVISDEIYEHLIYDGLKHVSIASLGEKISDLTVVVNGVSKSHSMTGWRIGYIGANNEEIITAINKLQSHSTSNPCSISQKAALEALASGRSSLEDMVMEFGSRRDYMIARINEMKALGFVKPSGAFYLFCDISKLGMDSTTFSQRLLEEAHVASIPGVAFGWDTHARFSFATSMDNIKEGVGRLEQWLEKQ